MKIIKLWYTVAEENVKKNQNKEKKLVINK